MHARDCGQKKTDLSAHACDGEELGPTSSPLQNRLVGKRCQLIAQLMPVQHSKCRDDCTDLWCLMCT